VIRDVGDRQNIEHRVYDPFTDPPALTAATVALSVTDPAGVVTTPSITNPSTGIYRSSFTLATAGVWYWRWTVSGTVVDVADGEVTAADPGPVSYASLEELRDRLRITSPDDTAEDSEMLDRLAAASRRVDRDTGRRHGFWADKTATARTYRPTHEELLIVDDMAVAPTSVAVGSGSSFTTIASTAYDFIPENALADNRALEVIRLNSGVWPCDELTRVRVTARWGWPSIPDEIHEATLLLAARLFRRKDSPEGVRGFSDLGVIRVGRYDPDYTSLIDAYVRTVI
jgi:hypothetical protein